MSDPRQPRRQLWHIAQDFIVTLFNLFGQPEAIAARHTILRDEWRLITSWLRAGEALMRQLLLVEAAALPKPNTRPILWKRRARKRRVMSFSAEEPETWRVSFRCFNSMLSRRGAKRGEPVSVGHHAAADESASDQRVLTHAWPGSTEHAAQFKSAWPLAERAEALLRVFNDPSAYAQRLARRLYAKPHRARAVMRFDPGSPPLVGEIAFATVRGAAGEACAAFDSS